MVLRIQEDGAVRDIPIRAGETFLLPPRVPHSPQRMPDSIGLVIERKRLPHEDDGLLWFCEQCNAKMYEEFFHAAGHRDRTSRRCSTASIPRANTAPASRAGTSIRRPSKYVMPDT